MALTGCRYCQKEVDSNAGTCHHCGAPIKRRFLGCMTIVSILFLIGFIGAMIVLIGRAVSPPTSKSADHKIKTTAHKTNRAEGPGNRLACKIMMKFVEEYLHSPESLKLPSFSEDLTSHVESLGNQKYRISSWFDLTDVFGATIRTYFTGEVEQVSEDQWQLVSFCIK